MMSSKISIGQIIKVIPNTITYVCRIHWFQQMVDEYHALVPLTVLWGCMMILYWSLSVFHLSRLAEQ